MVTNSRWQPTAAAADLVPYGHITPLDVGLILKNWPRFRFSQIGYPLWWRQALLTPAAHTPSTDVHIYL
jgi:hypothetical protein